MGSICTSQKMKLKSKTEQLIYSSILKCIHCLLATIFWTTGLIKSIFSLFFSITMHSMLKGSEISDIHNLTTNLHNSNSGNIKHAALIVSEDWTGMTVNNENLQIDVISQIIMWLIISGVTVLTIYDQSGRLKIGKEDVKNAVSEKLLEIILNEKNCSKDKNQRYSLLEKMILNQNRQALQRYVHQNSNNKSELLKNLTNLRMDLKIDQHDSD